MMQAGGIILLYHRVTRLATDPQLLAVSPEHFAEHLELLKRIARPMRLGEMVSRARHGEDLNGAVAITFDDGYADNLLEAGPILKAADVPATVFVAAGGIDSTREFFWDELDRILLQPGGLPEKLRVEVGEVRYETNMGAAVNYSREEWERFRHWNVTMEDNPTARQRVYREVCGLIHQMTSAQREIALGQILKWSGLESVGRLTHRMMTAEQLRELALGGLIEVGGHTVSHPLLSAESVADQTREISEGKVAIEEILGSPVRSFSYPFGGRRDYTADTMAVVKEAGFEYACSNFRGMVTAETDPFQLPRMIVRDWSAGELDLAMSRIVPPLAA